MKSLVLSVLLVFLSTGCAVWPLNHIYSGPTTRETKKVQVAQTKTETVQAKIDAAKAELAGRISALESNQVSQGSALVYGTGRALDRVSTNEPAVLLAKDLNNLATQALPRPAEADAARIDKLILDRLNASLSAQAAGLAELNALKAHLASTEGALASTIKEHEVKLSALQEAGEKAQKAERAKAETVAAKANLFDQADSLVGSAALFLKNAWKTVVGLTIVGILIAIVWFGLKAYGVVNPAVGAATSVVGKVVSAGESDVVAGAKAFESYVAASPLTSDVKNFVLGLFHAAAATPPAASSPAALKAATSAIV